MCLLTKEFPCTDTEHYHNHGNFCWAVLTTVYTCLTTWMLSTA